LVKKLSDSVLERHFSLESGKKFISKLEFTADGEYGFFSM